MTVYNHFTSRRRLRPWSTAIQITCALGSFLVFGRIQIITTAKQEKEQKETCYLLSQCALSIRQVALPIPFKLLSVAMLQHPVAFFVVVEEFALVAIAVGIHKDAGPEREQKR